MKKYDEKQMNKDVVKVNSILRNLEGLTEWNEELDELYYHLTEVRDSLIELLEEEIMKGEK